MVYSRYVPGINMGTWYNKNKLYKQVEYVYIFGKEIHTCYILGIHLDPHFN